MHLSPLTLIKTVTQIFAPMHLVLHLPLTISSRMRQELVDLGALWKPAMGHACKLKVWIPTTSFTFLQTYKLEGCTLFFQLFDPISPSLKPISVFNALITKISTSVQLQKNHQYGT